MGIKENHATIKRTEEGSLILEPTDVIYFWILCNKFINQIKFFIQAECGDYMFVNGDKVYDSVEL